MVDYHLILRVVSQPACSPHNMKFASIWAESSCQSSIWNGHVADQSMQSDKLALTPIDAFFVIRHRRTVGLALASVFIVSVAFGVDRFEDWFFFTDLAREQLSYEFVGGISYGIYLSLMALVAAWWAWRPASVSLLSLPALVPFVALLLGSTLPHVPFRYGLEYAALGTLEVVSEFAIALVLATAYCVLGRMRFVDLTAEARQVSESRLRSSHWSIQGLLAAISVFAGSVALEKWQRAFAQSRKWEIYPNDWIYALSIPVAMAICIIGVGHMLTCRRWYFIPLILALTLAPSWSAICLGEKMAYGTPEFTSNALSLVTLSVILYLSKFFWHALKFRLAYPAEEYSRASI